MPKEKADVKMIHDENNVLTDDELVIPSMHVYTIILVDPKY